MRILFKHRNDRNMLLPLAMAFSFLKQLDYVNIWDKITYLTCIKIRVVLIFAQL